VDIELFKTVKPPINDAPSTQFLSWECIKDNRTTKVLFTGPKPEFPSNERKECWHLQFPPDFEIDGKIRTIARIHEEHRY
jgi:hypothetical protein